MSRLQTEIQLAVYLLESKKSLRQCHYRKQFAMLNYHLERLNNQSHFMKIKICRRLIYCLLKILQSYQKHDELNTNKKTYQLFREIQRYFIIYYNSMEEYYNRDFDKKSKVKMSFYARDMMQLLLRTMQIKAVHLQGTSLDARGMNKFFKTQENIFQIYRKKIECFRKIFINFNLKQGQMYYMLALFHESHFFYSQSLEHYQPLIQRILSRDPDYEQETSQNEMNRTVNANKHHFKYLIGFTPIEMINDYYQAIESLYLAKWMTQFFFFHRFRELIFFISNRINALQTKYAQHILEDFEIKRMLDPFVEDHQSQPQTVRSKQEEPQLYETLSTVFYKKFHHDQLNSTQSIMYNETKASMVEPSSEIRRTDDDEFKFTFATVTQSGIKKKKKVKELQVQERKLMKEQRNYTVSEFQYVKKPQEENQPKMQKDMENQSVKQALQKYYQDLVNFDWDECNQFEEQQKYKNFQHRKVQWLFELDKDQSAEYLKFKKSFKTQCPKYHPSKKRLEHISVDMRRKSKLMENVIGAQMIRDQYRQKQIQLMQANIKKEQEQKEKVTLKTMIMGQSQILGLSSLKKQMRKKQNKTEEEQSQNVQKSEEQIMKQIQETNKKVMQFYLEEYDKNNKKEKGNKNEQSEIQKELKKQSQLAQSTEFMSIKVDKKINQFSELLDITCKINQKKKKQTAHSFVQNKLAAMRRKTAIH